jgi:hypothetical protein
VRILLDHCVAKGFRQELTGHQVRTAFEMGWSNLKNGALLAEAAGQFDALITVDQNLQFQQNLASLPLPVLMLVTTENDRDALKPFGQSVLQVLAARSGRPLLRIHPDGRVETVTKP